MEPIRKPARRYASGLRMKELTTQLRAEFPQAAQVRIRRALSKGGERIYQLVGVLPGGQRIARQLDAKSEVHALVAAQQMLSMVGEAGLVSPGRTIPSGQLKVIQRMSLQSVENRQSKRGNRRKPISEQHKRYLTNAVLDCMSHLQDAGLACNTGTLRSWALQAPEDQRERRRRLEAIRIVAAAANINLETKDITYCEPHAPTRLKLADINEKGDFDLIQVLYKADMVLSDDAAWAVHVVATLGIRGIALCSIRPPLQSVHTDDDGHTLPTGMLLGGDPIPFWDSKRGRQGQATPSLEAPFTWARNVHPTGAPSVMMRLEEAMKIPWDHPRVHLKSLSEIPPGWLKLRGPIDRDPPPELYKLQQQKVNSVNEEVRRKMGEWAPYLGFRQLRHHVITRLLKKGIPSRIVAELASTSEEQINRTYGHLYASEAVTLAQAMLKMKSR